MQTSSQASTLNDDQLVECYKSGGGELSPQDAMEELFSRYSKLLISFLSSRVKPRSEAEEIASEVWIKVIQVVGMQFKGGNFKAWLVQIARSKMIDFFRKKHPDRLAENHDVSEDVDHTSILMQDERIEALRDCIGQLSDSRREIVVARMQGLSSKEISTDLGLIVTTVNTRFSRAKDSLSRCMEQKSL